LNTNLGKKCFTVSIKRYPEKLPCWWWYQRDWTYGDGDWDYFGGESTSEHDLQPA